MQFADPDPARIWKIHIGGIIRIWIRIRSGTSLQIHAICGSGPCPDPENPPWWNHKNPFSKHSPGTSSSSLIQFADRKIRPDGTVRIRIRTRFRILLIPSLPKKNPHSLKFLRILPTPLRYGTGTHAKHQKTCMYPDRKSESETFSSPPRTIHGSGSPPDPGMFYP
jgi:hypothetical protein